MSKEFIELKNKTIFITGVAGFIGSNLAERPDGTGYRGTGVNPQSSAR